MNFPPFQEHSHNGVLGKQFDFNIKIELMKGKKFIVTINERNAKSVFKYFFLLFILL